MPDEEPIPEVTEDWLDGICNFTGYESGFPAGIIAPRDFVIITDYIKAGVGKFSLTKDLPNGLIEVDEDVVKFALNFDNILIITANGVQLTRPQFIDQFKRDPILVLGWMRKKPGLWTPKGRVNQDGSIAGMSPEDAIKIGGKGGIRTPDQMPIKEGKTPIKLGKY
ncbi:MAG: hypothetical protein O8C67_15370 [Candidatus Methanoperedens sp.]|nr:hypothetical protein [Candidatus Methanoperedens sp.]